MSGFAPGAANLAARGGAPRPRSRRVTKVDNAVYFHYSRNMETKIVVEALSALAQETRLNVYRLLVESGPEGIAAGRIGEQLSLPPATLSFHLAHLSRAGLIRSRQVGRFIYYSTDFDNMNALVQYLTENCCAGSAYTPVVCKPRVASRDAVRRKARASA